MARKYGVPDAENPELTREEIMSMRPAEEVFPEAFDPPVRAAARPRPAEDADETAHYPAPES